MRKLDLALDERLANLSSRCQLVEIASDIRLRARLHQPASASAFAAQMKSFSLRPPTSWVE